MELTDAGRALVPEARRTIAAAAAARSAVADVQGLERGSVSIGTGKALPIDLIMILTRFREAHPNIALNLHQGGSLELGRSNARWPTRPSRRSACRAASCRSNGDRTGHRAESVACLPHHRLANRQRVRIAELADEAFVDFDPAWGIRLVNDDWFAEADVQRRVEFTVNDVDMLLDIVTRGLGVAIVPRSVAHRTSPVSLVSLGRAAPRWNVGIVVSADRPPSAAAQRLLEMVQAAAS